MVKEDWANAGANEKNKNIFYGYSLATLIVFVLVAYSFKDFGADNSTAKSIVVFVSDIIPQVKHAYENWTHGRAANMIPPLYCSFWLYNLSITPIFAFFGRREKLFTFVNRNGDEDEDNDFLHNIGAFAVAPVLITLAYYFQIDFNTGNINLFDSFYQRASPSIIYTSVMSTLIYYFYMRIFKRLLVS